MFVVVFGILGLSEIRACDACGCALNSNGIGLLSSYKNNFLSFRWQSNRFHSVPGHTVSIRDQMHTLEFSGRINLSGKFKILFQQPFKINSRISQGQTASLSGFSDATIMGSYTLLSRENESLNSRFFLEGGMGIKTPTGVYRGEITQENLPENFNTGNGSWGTALQVNMVYTRGKSGLALGGQYLHLGQTDSGYRFGHQWSGQGFVFYEHVATNRFKWIPSLGIHGEWIRTDVFDGGVSAPGTGGKGIFLTSAFQVKWDQWFGGITFSQPLSHRYGGGEMIPGSRIALQWTYLF